MTENLKIILGGGRQKRDGWLNLDIIAHPEVDIVCDLNKGIPLHDDTVIEMQARHVLEHLESISFITEEMWRVSKSNARIIIKTPYYASIGAFKDPTHKSFITEYTFDYFSVRRNETNLPDYHYHALFDIEYIGYIWSSPWIRFMPFKSFLRRHFLNIARTIIIILRVVK